MRYLFTTGDGRQNIYSVGRMPICITVIKRNGKSLEIEKWHNIETMVYEPF